MSLLFINFLRACGLPTASETDIDAWNQLDGSSSQSANTRIKVGIFGYDMTCIATRCILGDISDTAGRCDMIEARGLDGLAFGVNFEVDIGSGQYCAGFHNPYKNDNASCNIP
jgi:hypothetical protein